MEMCPLCRKAFLDAQGCCVRCRRIPRIPEIVIEPASSEVVEKPTPEVVEESASVIPPLPPLVE